MADVFYRVLYMTIIGSIVGILVYFIRNIFDKKMSGKAKCMLWSIVLITLLVPVRFELKTSYTIVENNFVDIVENIKNVPNYENKETLTEVKQVQNIPAKEENVEEQNTYKMPLETKIKNIIIPYIWLTGCVFLILTFSSTTINIRKKILKGIYKDERIENILNECKNQLNIKKNVNIVLQKYKRVPSIFGISNPSILITEKLLQEDDQTIKYIFLHELSHYKRRDTLLNYILLATLSIHWFNPIIWFLFSKIRQDIEIGADELASKGLTKSQQKEYGMVLINSLRNQTEENYTANLLCMSDTEKNMERRIRMLKGKSKSLVISMIIIGFILAVVICFVFIKSGKIEPNKIIDKVVEKVTEDESLAIGTYINEICNNYFASGRVSIFDRIENADKDWIYSHIKAEETMINPRFAYEYISAYASKESIEDNLKKLFGEDYDINLERDNEYIENNMFMFDEQVGKYEQIPWGNDMTIYYFINTINKVDDEYIVNVLENVIVDDYNEQYGDVGTYSIIETFKDYDHEKALIDNGKEIFHIESSKIYSIIDGKSALKVDVLKDEVLKRKSDFLAYNITIKKDENGNFVVQKIEEADVNT